MKKEAVNVNECMSTPKTVDDVVRTLDSLPVGRIDGLIHKTPEIIKDTLRASITALLTELERQTMEKMKSQQYCSCGGQLVKSRGTGSPVFPLQCATCGSYTDYTADGYNTALQEVLTIIKSMKGEV